MHAEERSATGPEYLDLVTTLGQRVRCEDETAGVWEPADFQWWWRRERSSDHLPQCFWTDETGAPVAALVLTDWGETWGCDPIVLPSAREAIMPAVWSRGLQRIDELSPSIVEVMVPDDDLPLLELVIASGFLPSGAADTITTWMDVSDLPPVTTLTDGFTLHDRRESREHPHHLIPRSGESVTERLSQTSLYRPDLDLWIRGPAGDVAAYGLFWWDPVTSVGLVEPMRTEDRYRRLGLARHLLTCGLGRLAAFGATRLKVGYETENPAAETLYLMTGFRPDSTSRVFRRQS